MLNIIKFILTYIFLSTSIINPGAVEDISTKQVKEYLTTYFEYKMDKQEFEENFTNDIEVISNIIIEEKPEPKVEVKEEVIKVEKQKNVKEEIAARPGMVGRFSIPEFDIDVAIFNSVSQSVADAKDSANYFAFGDMMVLGDHWNQDNFNNIKQCTEGTKAYIDTGTEIKEYICVKSFTGHNKVNVMTDENGVFLNYGHNTDGLTLYTCNGTWQNIWICFFRPVVNGAVQ